MRRFLPVLPLFLALATPLAAQDDFTTPEGAATIHQAIKDQVLSFRPDGDQDFIYFTAILGWRCGVKELYFRYNDEPAEYPWPLEPCHRELRNPNTMTGDISQYPIFVTVPRESAQKVTLRVVYENGTEAVFESLRAKNLIN